MTKTFALNFQSLLPWHQEAWELLQHQRLKQQVPNALLITGVPGVGKHFFAQQWAQSLLCEQPQVQGMACGKCISCRLFQGGTHSDFLQLSSSEEQQTIKIDDIREIIELNQKTTNFGSWKVMILQNAHTLNVYAANALLKTLEEPNDHTCIILITDHPLILPATLRSRCQLMSISTPSSSSALAWLKQITEISSLAKPHDFSNLNLLLALAYGAPFKVLQYMETDELNFREMILKQWLDFCGQRLSVIGLAKQWSAQDLLRLFHHWKSWIIDIIKIQQTGNKENLINQDFMSQFQSIALRINIKELYHFLDELNRYHEALLKNVYHLNACLMIENLLIEWVNSY
jgi:DNA polymerase III subunit delta'